MPKFKGIENWECPLWHKDFGNPKSEFELLRRMCDFLNNLSLNYQFVLDSFEEGYMRVLVNQDAVELAEIQVINSNESDQKIGIFTSLGNEDYFNSIDEFKKSNHFLIRGITPIIQ